MSQTAFAKEMGTSQQAVCRWVRRQRTPSAKHVAAIHRLTRGKVTLSDWMKNA